jgi:hypothetical protein
MLVATHVNIRNGSKLDKVSEQFMVVHNKNICNFIGHYLKSNKIYEGVKGCNSSLMRQGMFTVLC